VAVTHKNGKMFILVQFLCHMDRIFFYFHNGKWCIDWDVNADIMHILFNLGSWLHLIKV